MTNRLQEWRIRTRHTQQEVANILGISPTAVNRHEAGSRLPTHWSIIRYAQLYKIPTYALFYKPDPGDINPPAPGVNNYIRNLRVDMNLTEEELGKLVKIDPIFIERWETKRWGLTHTQIVKLARVFKVPTYRLFVENQFDRAGEVSFEQDEYADADASDVDTRGDEGTPYEEFKGGYRSQVAMATAQ